jgi:hypothetical protein
MNTWIADLIFLLVTSGFALYLNVIKKDVKKLTNSFDGLTKSVENLDETVKSHTITITEITLCNSVMARVDLKIKQSLEYIHKDDVIIQTFIQKQGEMAKECIEWAIHNKLKVSEAEIRAKYESCNIEVRDLLTKTPPEFSNAVRPALLAIVNHHVQRVITIATDELFNSKLDRFFTLTEQTINEVLTSVVRARIENELGKA